MRSFGFLHQSQSSWLAFVLRPHNHIKRTSPSQWSAPKGLWLFFICKVFPLCPLTNDASKCKDPLLHPATQRQDLDACHSVSSAAHDIDMPNEVMHARPYICVRILLFSALILQQSRQTKTQSGPAWILVFVCVAFKRRQSLRNSNKLRLAGTSTLVTKINIWRGKINITI